jgi:hypothetical protein
VTRSCEQVTAAPARRQSRASVSFATSVPARVALAPSQIDSLEGTTSPLNQIIKVESYTGRCKEGGKHSEEACASRRLGRG